MILEVRDQSHINQKQQQMATEPDACVCVRERDQITVIGVFGQSAVCVCFDLN